MKRISLIIGILIGLGTLAAGIISVDCYFAKASELEMVALRLDQKIRQDRCDWMQQRIWQLEDRYQVMPMPDAVKQEYRKLKADYERECK